MAINWGILQNPQRMPSVVGQGQSFHQNANIGKEAQDFMGMMNQGMDMRVKMQQMDQSKQLFPSVLSKAQSDAKTAQSDATIAGVNAQNAVQKWQDLQATRTAFQQSYQAGVASLMKTDPQAAAALQNTAAQTKNQLAEAAEHMANTESQSMSIYTGMATTLGTLVSTAHNAQQTVTQQTGDPKQGAQAAQQVWAQSLSMVPPSLRSMFPQQYNNATYFAGVQIGSEAMFQKQQQTIMTNASPQEKDDIIIGNLQQAEKNGTITPPQQVQLDNARKRTNSEDMKNESNVQKTTDYISGLKTQLSNTPPNTPQFQDLQDKYNFAVKQANKDTGLVSSIINKFSGSSDPLSQGILNDLTGKTGSSLNQMNSGTIQGNSQSQSSPVSSGGNSSLQSGQPAIQGGQAAVSSPQASNPFLDELNRRQSAQGQASQ